MEITSQNIKLLTVGIELSPQEKEMVAWLEAEMSKRIQAMPKSPRVNWFMVMDELMQIERTEKTQEDVLC